jgi:coenzyme F420-reducing hydrogenase alpha subunit
MATRKIDVETITRVEGEGALRLKVRDGQLEDVQLNIYEPPRFFEAFLRGRSYTEPPDITARICGICPVAYQMSSCHAIEAACGVKVGEPIRTIRRLLYCGEWIESHVLHVAFLHAPDFLGYMDAIRMAADHGAVVQLALKMKKTGNKLVTIVGGREIHPINVRVGGFYKAPSKKDLRALLDPLKEAADGAEAMLRWAKPLDYPDFDRPYELVCVKHPDEYPFNEGRVVSTGGIDIDPSQYDDVFEERHVEHSNALHSVVKARGHYLTGPLARFVLCYDQLTPRAKAAAAAAGLTPAVRNPFLTIMIRCVETLYAIEEAIRIIEAYEEPDRPYEDVPPRAGKGYGCTEAPRGMLCHHYTLDSDGTILDAEIIPPTSQNLASMEDDIRAFAGPRLGLPDAELAMKCEHAIRNHDPCISCATHFLKLEVDRQ